MVVKRDLDQTFIDEIVHSSSPGRLDEVAARVGGRRRGGEGDRAQRVYRHRHHRGVAEAQSRKRRRAHQGREPRSPARITAGPQPAVVRECRRQHRAKVRRIDCSHIFVLQPYSSRRSQSSISFSLSKSLVLSRGNHQLTITFINVALSHSTM